MKLKMTVYLTSLLSIFTATIELSPFIWTFLSHTQNFGSCATVTKNTNTNGLLYCYKDKREENYVNIKSMKRAYLN